MAAEERRIISNSMDEEDPRHRFPAGLRVLAVDDDPTCLKVLEQLLRSCHYHVTTTNQAMVALNILRENRNKFDLVISDVKMPDMDGLKLLELVGLEMDLPVIMMSAHGDTKLVMEGISHGACDYLLKPVRIEEIKNIWQHVMRKKTFGGIAKVRNISPSGDKAVQGTGEGGHGQDAAALGNGDQNGRANRKRKEKEQDEDDDEDEDDNENENEEPGSSSHKKPRVVWTVELHQRFVQAVNELGVEKAVPKKILDKMNDERLTRENVASHLQKYRLYLRRINGGGSQDGSAFGGKDAYLRALEGFRDFRSFPGTARLSNAALSTYMPGGMLSRLNSPSGLNMHGLPSGIIQPGQSSSNPIGTFGKLQPSVLPTNQNSSLFQGIPTSFGVSQLNPINNQTSFAVSSSFPTSFSSNSLSTMSSNPLILQGNMQNTQSVGGIGSSSSASLNPEPFNIGASCSSSFLGRGRSNENWNSAAQFSRFQSNSLPLTQPFSHDQLPSLSEGFRSSGLPIQIQRSPTAVVSVGMEDLGGDMQGQVGFINNVIPNMNFTSNQRWENNSNQAFSSLDSLIPANGGVGSFSQGLGQNSIVCTQNMESTLIGDFNGGAHSHIQNNEVNRSAMNTMMKSPEDYTEHIQSQANYVQNGFESLDDLMASSPWMIKREQGETLLEGDFVFGDGYSPDSYIQET